MSNPESVIQSKIIKALTEEGHYVFKVVSANRKGIPDLIACVDGRFVAIEVKTDTGMPTPLQDLNMDKIVECGGLAGVCRSVEDVWDLLNGKLCERGLSR